MREIIPSLTTLLTKSVIKDSERGKINQTDRLRCGWSLIFIFIVVSQSMVNMMITHWDRDGPA